MERNVKLAPLLDNHDIVNDISKYEHELKKKTGKDIILIAYMKEESK